MERRGSIRSHPFLHVHAYAVPARRDAPYTDLKNRGIEFAVLCSASVASRMALYKCIMIVNMIMIIIIILLLPPPGGIAIRRVCWLVR